VGGVCRVALLVGGGWPGSRCEVDPRQAERHGRRHPIGDSRAQAPVKHRSRWGLDPRVVIALATAVVLLLAVGLASIREQRRTIEAGDWVRHTIRVLEQITLVLQRVSDAESGQRGYVLTGHPSYLKTYHDTTATLPQDIP